MKRKSLLFLLLFALLAPWAANAQTVTVCNGTDNSNKVPFDGYNADSPQHNQMIFPATDLSAMNGKEITQMVFYIDQSASNGSYTAADRLGTWTVSLGETEATTLSGLDNTTTLTQVYQGYFDCSTGTLTLAFSSNYLYHGGNLLVDLNHAASGWNTWYFLGVTATGASYTYGSQRNFLPKTTFSYQTPPTCPAPTLNAAEYVIENQASFSWTENGSATDWVLQYSTSEDFTNAISRDRHGIPALVISDFQPLTTYYVRVKADCGGGDQSLWSNVISFTTTAVAQNVGDGWADDFEGTSCGWELINGTVTQANWFWGTAENSGSGSHSIYTTNDNGNTCSYNTSSAARVYAAKLLTFADGKYTFQFDWKCNGETTSYDYLSVGLLPATAVITADNTNSGTLPTGWISVHDATYLNGVTAWQTSPEKTVQLESGNYYLVLRWRQDGSGGTGTGAAVDNVSITKVTCDQDVTNLAVSEITTNSATLSWNGGEAEQWQVAYSTNNNFEGATEEIVSTASYNMSGLQSSSTYFVKVRAYCGGEDFGTWCQAISFTTACDVIPALGYSENFDSYTAGNNVLPTCWSYINTTTNSTYAAYPRVYADGSYYTYASSAPNCLYFYSYGSSDPQPQYAILPEMTGLAGLQVTLMAKGYNASSTLKIGTMSDPADASTFTMIAEQTLTTSYPTDPFEYLIPADCSDSYLAIMMDAAPSGYNTRGVYVDDIVVRKAPTCLKPTELAVTGVSATTATLGWTNGADDQTAWQICLNGDETNLIMANSNPFTIDEEGVLAPSTTYTAKVRAYCNADDQSEWSDEVSFATACEAITIDETHTYSEGFEGYTGVSYSATDGVMPVCWDSYSTGSVAPHIIGSGSYYYHHDGTNALTFYGSGYCYAAMPEFTNALSELEIKFWMQTESATNGDLTLGYITDEDVEYNTFTEIETYENNSGSMVQRTTDLNEVPTTATRLVFRWSYENQWSCCIDDVEVTLIPTCTKPTALECTATTTTTATLSWTAGANETAWQICLNGDETNLIEANSNPFTVENLTAATAYTAKVRAYCGEEDQSDWSNEVSFATECEAIVVDAANPFTEDFEGDWTPLCWESIPYIDGSTTRQWTKTTTVHNGAGAAYSGYYGPIYLVMPDLQLGTDGNAAQLTFWSYNNYVNDYDKNSIVLLDGENEVELWSPESVVNSWEETTIDLTAYMGQTISLAFKYEGNNAHGWYIDDVRVGGPFFTKDITGYGTGTGNWYLIASPIGQVAPTAVTNMLSNTYDFYRFNQSASNEWENYKNSEHQSFSFEPGKGYLYANSQDVQLVFNGTAYTGNATFDLVYDADANLAGMNLVGNPFAETAYIADGRSFYTMQNNGTEILTSTSNSIELGEGVFVEAENDDDEITFTTTAPENKGAKLALNLSNGRAVIDRAIVSFGEGRQLSKFQLNKSHTKVYIPVEGKDYAVVRAEEMGEMPVNFMAESNGTYSLSFSSENAEFAYLHLIDNLTGTDVDLLETPSYSFEASTTDYASRFKLVFATGSSTGSETFAFYSNGSFVINNEGNATLQVIDVMGRIVKSESVNGCTSVNVNAAPGVYMLRLLNGDNVKTQKVVVK